MKMILKGLAAGAITALLTAAPAGAQVASWPNQPIKLIVPTTAGGGNDSAARHLAQYLGESLGQPVVVENVPGAGNITGTALVARSAPDGYTLLSTGVSAVTISPHLYPSVPYELDDLTAVGQLNESIQAIIVNPDNMPFETLEELIAELKAEPGEYNFGSNGIGGIGHLAMELLMMRTDMQMIHVPFKGGGEVVTALLGGHVDLAFSNTTSVLGQLQEGSLRAIAVPAVRPVEQLPDVPTISKVVADFPSFGSWVGIFAPAGTPDAIVDRLANAIAEYRETEEAIVFAEAAGSTIAETSREEFSEIVQSDSARWGEVIERIGLELN